MCAKHTISYPDDLEETIQDHIEAGIAESRSEWFRKAAWLRLNLLDSFRTDALAVQMLHHDLNPEVIADITDHEFAQQAAVVSEDGAAEGWDDE
jgi:Arc/MetJ-type ribon-helix-helix transcriptional regulator